MSKASGHGLAACAIYMRIRRCDAALKRRPSDLHYGSNDPSGDIPLPSVVQGSRRAVRDTKRIGPAGPARS
jgi:hypothetical protein